jgi:hypothetical protein
VHVPQVRESYLGALLARCENVDGAAMHAKTGELLPGVRFETGEPYARVTQTHDQQAAFVQAWRAGAAGTRGLMSLSLPEPEEGA